MDVVSAFLNGELDEDIYMKQLKGYVSKQHPSKVCKLQRSLCGLTQFIRCWNQMDYYLKSSTNYLHPEQRDPFDDIRGLSWWHHHRLERHCHLAPEKKRLSKAFEMDDRGKVYHILGMEWRYSATEARRSSPSTRKHTWKKFCGVSGCSTQLEPGKNFNKIFKYKQDSCKSFKVVE